MFLLRQSETLNFLYFFYNIIDIEEKNKIVKVDYIKSLVEEKIESFDGKELGFCSLYEEIMERDDDLSDIGPDNRSETNFDSIIGEV